MENNTQDNTQSIYWDTIMKEFERQWYIDWENYIWCSWPTGIDNILS